jgi:uncharacterized protein (DUF4213/DUF364 family)
MNQFRDIYARIIQLYREEGLTPENLEGIGFHGSWTTVFGTMDQSGMAFNFTGEHAVYGQIDPRPLTKLQRFIGKRLTYLAEYLAEYLAKKDDILYQSLYLAVLNALSNPLNTAERLKKRGFSFISPDNFDFVKEDDFVTVIGAGGVVKQLRQLCKEVHVSDMRPKNTLESIFVGDEICKGPARLIFHNPNENEELLSQSDIVFMTGCTLVNQTIFDLLPMIKKARVIGLFGPSSMILPDFICNLGVNYIKTSRITNLKIMKDYMLDGFGGKIPEECMENYSITI